LARRPSLRASLVIVAVLSAGLVAGYLGWFRDSSLVAVRDVTVSGVSSADKGGIEAALTEAAGSMTTLNVSESELEEAVARFPTVVSVSADPKLFHGLAIEVVERPPALLVSAGGETVPAAGDGTLLRGLELSDQSREALPVIDVRALPRQQLSGEPLAKATVAGAAPEPLLELIEGISFDGQTGVEVTMKGDIPIRFGTAEQAGRKWAAAAAVLADPKLDTLTYLDVRAPERPAVGGAAAPTAEVAEPVTPEPTL
jgi:cell division septal protein FtsQ